MPKSKQSPSKLQLRAVRPWLPGPWQYLDILPAISLIQNRLRDAPNLAYPLLALLVWRTIQRERRERAKALLHAHREAIRRSQQIWVVKPKPQKRFLIF